MSSLLRYSIVLMLVAGAWVPQASAHCDTMDGPVVADARLALEKKDLAPILKWISADREEEVRQAFTRTLAVRVKGAEARELADLWFFETLVRLHRAGENAPYTGLKPAGTDAGPAVRAADKALQDGSPEAVVGLVRRQVEEGIRLRFEKALEARKHADHNAEAGRSFVRAYVEFMHHVEAVLAAAAASTDHQAAAHPHSDKPTSTAHPSEHSQSHHK